MSSGKTFRPAGDSDDDEDNDDFGGDWANGGGDNGDGGGGGGEKSGQPENGVEEEKADDWRADVLGEGYKNPAPSWPFESLGLEFRRAVTSDDAEAVVAILEKKPALASGPDPAIEAAVEGSERVLGLLLERGASFGHDASGFTALMAAASASSGAIG